MKVKKIQIRIMDMDKWFDHVGNVLKDFNKKKYKPYKKTVSFENLELLRKTLTPRRIQLLSVVKNKKPRSIYELSKILHRERKSVTNDINILKELGFINLKKETKERTMMRPEVRFEEIEIGVRI